MKKILAALFLVTLSAAPAFAGKYDISLLQSLNNSKFNDVVKQAGAVIAYRGVAPGEPQGITGFDVGVETSFFKVDKDVWAEVIDDVPTYLPGPKLHARKGLPFGIDLGASYSTVPSSNIKVIGAELQYAILDGGIALPALSVRGHYSTLLGVDDLDLKTYGADVVASKGVLFLTPYVGAGVMRTEGKYTGSDPVLKPLLNDQSATTPRVFGGVQIAVALLRLTLDAEFSDVPVYTAKASIGW